MTGTGGGWGWGGRDPGGRGREDSPVPSRFTSPNLPEILEPSSPTMVSRRAVLLGRSPDEAPPPGRLPGPSSNVSALAERGSHKLKCLTGPRSPGRRSLRS